MTPEEKAFLVRTIPPPTAAEHVEYSMIFSAADELSIPSDYLILLALGAVKGAMEINLSWLSARLPSPPYYPDIWPGEHYRLLAALVAELSPSLIIEIGTGRGLSALCMKEFLPPQGKILSFDLHDLPHLPQSCLLEKDFTDGRLQYHNADLSNPETLQCFSSEIERAELIFIDGPKDNVTEWKLLGNLRTLSFKKPPLLVLDDIRLWNMLQFWRLISMPKLDLTSFGHWSGTGLVEWRQQ